MQKSDARARWHQSTVPVEALRHHADLQAHRHHRAIGINHDEPDQSPPQHARNNSNQTQSSRTMVRPTGAALLTWLTFGVLA